MGGVLTVRREAFCGRSVDCKERKGEFFEILQFHSIEGACSELGLGSCGSSIDCKERNFLWEESLL